MVKRGQISFEYLIVMGFVSFVLISIIGIAFFYTYSFESRARMDKAFNLGNDMIYNIESVFYSGEPSKVVVNLYVPEGFKEMKFVNNSLYLSVTTQSGLNTISFSSKVPIHDSVLSSVKSGVNKFEIKVYNGKVNVSRI